MLKADRERLIKIISNWNEVQDEIKNRNITADDILIENKESNE